MNKEKLYSFIFSTTATGALMLAGWLVLVACDRILLLLG